jgi:hypothetical protein
MVEWKHNGVHAQNRNNRNILRPYGIHNVVPASVWTQAEINANSNNGISTKVFHRIVGKKEDATKKGDFQVW